MPALPEYAPYREIGGRPHIIVDGAPLKSTVLTLSHWPSNATPDVLQRDTSTATVFAYLDNPSLHVDARFVSNNHFDEDGLFSMFALCYPATAMKYRDILQNAATAGDFGTYADPAAARLCFVIEAFADATISPLPADTFSGCEPRRVECLYRQMLERLPGLLENLDEFAEFWSEPDTHLVESEALLARGQVTIEEYPDFDLAVVQIPESLKRRTVRRYLNPERTAIHPFAIHNATNCNRIIRAQGNRLEFQYRYESWVRLVSKRPMLRADLSGLAARLNELETAHGIWRNEKISEVAPRLYLEGTEHSSLSLERFVREVSEYLAVAPVAWDPYDWQDGTAERDG